MNLHDAVLDECHLFAWLELVAPFQSVELVRAKIDAPIDDRTWEEGSGDA